ncbi:phage tail sheath subtilisin-like domain-containing protein [Methylobacterium pseudosasicola]|uniref:Mu-like prophage tail sheath protein gpL n=1 Tax=Methylobacterium pseudosasicola TaxID=582667 RepID=A0A1I4TID5_9HYPH|nr:phage tail sheath subtilisin-like domain-containing protein [Methylobacterium pseudosasicola]SFM76442.1 Mu-like prophage tail sheath protein gpL [Methylobacterium pseudosasicola]
MPQGPVEFNNTPGDVLVPAFMVEFNAGPPNYSGTSRQVILGRALPGSPAALRGLPINVGSQNPNALCGLGSIGAEQILYARQQNPLGEMLFIDATPQVGASPAASVGALSFAGTATATGTITRYLGGERYDVNVGIGDTAATVAAAFVAKFAQGYTKFNVRMLAPVSGAVKAGGTATATDVTLTARHPGTETNGWRIEEGLDGDEMEVPGITVAITPMASGTGDVDLAAVLAKLGGQNADWLCGPYSTTAQLNVVRDFLSDAGSGRSSPLVGLLGHYTTHNHGNLSTQTTFGQTRNDRHVTLAGIHQWPQAAWCISASLGGEIAFLKNLGRSLAVAVEIARPMQTRVLRGLRQPKDPNAIFAQADRDSLLRNGISTFTATADGQMACDRIVTTYRVNPSGLSDRTWLDIEDIAIAAYSARYFKNKIAGTYPRSAFMEDNPANLQGVVTPTDLEQISVHAATDLHRAGIIRQLDLFVQNMRIFPDYANDRANYYLPITAAAQLRINAVNQTSYLDQSDQGI